MKVEIKNQWSGEVQFVAEIECPKNARVGIKIGLAVKLAVDAKANLTGADLTGADLTRADLTRACLSGASLSRAINATLAVAQTLITPDGDLIGWKKLAQDVICKLRIPAEAKRHNASGRKCRAEFAVVLEGEGFSQNDSSLQYRIGETVRPREPFNENRWEESASGIHFYLTRIEAENQ